MGRWFPGNRSRSLREDTERTGHERANHPRVQQLPEAQRIVMLLIAVEGLSYSEAAEVLDVPNGTIVSRLSRARQAIGALFNDLKKDNRAKDAANSEEIGA